MVGYSPFQSQEILEYKEPVEYGSVHRSLENRLRPFIQRAENN